MVVVLDAEVATTWRLSPDRFQAKSWKRDSVQEQSILDATSQKADTLLVFKPMRA